MEHVVFYPGADGAEAFRRAADLEGAVRLVESLRNDEGIGDVSVFSLSPVPLAFRTYVHVELPVSQEAEAPSFQDVPIPPPPLPPTEEALEAAVTPAFFEVPESFEAPEPFEVRASSEVAAPPVPPVPPAPPSDFFEPIEEQEAFAELAEAEHVEHVDVEHVDAPVEDVWHASEAPDVAWADHEAWAETEPVDDEPWAEPAQAELEATSWSEAPEVAETPEPVLDDNGPIAIPEYHETQQDLPPLTLAPGPLHFDGDGAPLAHSGSYDLFDEAPAELTNLIPADFNDLIPKDIVHGDLARAAEEAAAQEPAVEAPVAEVVPAPFEGEPAPSTEDLPPMDLAEIPADVSSIEAFEAHPIPAARETTDEPAAALREGPRGLGFFGD